MGIEREINPAMLLVGHGTRDERGAAEFLATAKRISALVPEVAVEAGFLELAEPSIEAALERLVARGVGEVVVVPLLLFAAGHAKQDIPNDVAVAASRFSHLRIKQAEPLGCAEKVLAASAERFQLALPANDSESRTNVALIMVSRGTSDVSAIADVHRFVELRQRLTPVAYATTAFMAVAEPSVTTALDAVSRSPYQCVMVQPHLLFQGQLTSDLREMVNMKQAECPTKQWLLADHLGPCDLIAQAAIDRFRATRSMDD
ncbi:MAG: sirohydrochlorin chelatase [Planctomycetaceae bacterium]|nr:sirohydrochlorin chelatase [Planctomycetales bacterium]MCB9874803.1 sirohydrochlorin chelatase [Planctomycetaceae bacterium]